MGPVCLNKMSVPEKIMEKINSCKINRWALKIIPSSGVWGRAVVLYKLLSSLPYFRGENKNESYQQANQDGHKNV